MDTENYGLSPRVQKPRPRSSRPGKKRAQRRRALRDGAALGTGDDRGPECQPRLAYGDAAFSPAVGTFPRPALGTYRPVRGAEPVAAGTCSMCVIMPVLCRVQG